MIDTEEIVDHTQTTDTELHAVMYFAPFERLKDGEKIQIEHSGYEWDENDEVLTHEVQKIELVPDRLIVSDTYISDLGYTAHISPLGIRLDGLICEGTGQSWVVEKLIITDTDGSVYQVQDTDIYNQIFSCGSVSGDLWTVFNRLVDTEKVASITVNGPDGEDMVFTKEHTE